MKKTAGARNPRRRLVCFSFLAATALSGCLPVPNQQQVLPAIHGRVLSAGVPVRGVHIHIIARASGEELTERIATTGADGSFAHPGVTVKRHILWLMGDPIYDWTLYMHHADVWYNGYPDGRIGHPAHTVTLACDLQQDIEGYACVPSPAGSIKR